MIGGDIRYDPDEPDPSELFRSDIMQGRMGDQARAPVPLFTWHYRVWMTRDIPYIIEKSAS